MDPWTILGVTRDATPAEIRRQYLLKCRSFHPDKNSADDGQEFIKIKAAYDKLTGKDTELDLSDQDWQDIWRVTMEDILAFEKEFKGESPVDAMNRLS